MSPNSNDSEDLERLLNAWGRSKSTSGWRWWQWMPLIAAVVLAAAGVFMLNWAARKAESLPAASPAQTPSAQVQDLQARLTVAEGQLNQLRRALQETDTEKTRLAEEIRQAHQLYDELVAARREVERLSRAEIEDQGTIQDMLEALASVDEANKSLTTRIDQMQAQLEAAQRAAQDAEKLRAELAGLRTEHQALNDRLEAMRQSQMLLAEADAAAWRALQSGEVKIGAGDLAAMQTALKTTELLDQATDAAKLSDAETLDTVRKLETVFARLNTADPADEYEQAWASQIIAGDLLQEVAASLAEADSRKLPDQVRSFLVQAKVILRRGACGG